MNIKKSIDVAIAKSEYNNQHIAGELEITKQAFSQMKARNNPSSNTIEAFK